MSGLAVLSLTGGVACTAGVRPSATGTGGNAGSASTGSGGTAGTTSGPGLGGTGGDVILTGAGGGNPDASSCQQKEVDFAPTNPTVYLLVDRSGSMFHCLTGDTGAAVCADPTNTSWSNLKNAIEAVLPQLDSQVRFGFTTVWGTDPTQGGTCMSLQGTLTNNVSPALNNAGNIMTLYDGHITEKNVMPGARFESDPLDASRPAEIMFTACPIRYRPNLRFAVENAEPISVSLYNCLPPGKPTS